MRELEAIVSKQNYDSLTGLATRQYFGTMLNRTFKSLYSREINSVSLLFIDIDYFKNINDTYGHTVGDLVLQAVANVLSNTSSPFEEIGRGRHPGVVHHAINEHTPHKRHIDVDAGGSISRWGGEEIVGCLVDVSNPKEVGEKLRLAIETLRFEKYPELRVTVSIGVATTTVQTFVPKETLLKQADDAMYDAKESGRNRVVVANMG